LVKSVLSSLTLYYASIFKIPEGVLKSLEGIGRRFFGDLRRVIAKCFGFLGIRLWQAKMMVV